MQGKLVVSLDFELLWGVFDHETKESYNKRIQGARKVIPQMLEIFDEYGIHATWGTVGLLFADSLQEMKKYSPKTKPEYVKEKLSAYRHMEEIGENEAQDVFHFAKSLIDIIGNYENQELASHTFSHYYCKEKGQDVRTFEEDLQSAINIMEDKKNVTPKSLILPRNQFLQEYADAAKRAGFLSIRGTPKNYAYNNSTLLARGIRLIDTYVNICGKKCYTLEMCRKGDIINIPESRFFRAYNNKLKFLESMKIRCIKKQMRYAAKKGMVFHLWWHPHNFGKDPEKCLNQIKELFQYYNKLKIKYGFQSKNMGELAQEVLNEGSNFM